MQAEVSTTNRCPACYDSDSEACDESRSESYVEAFISEIVRIVIEEMDIFTVYQVLGVVRMV